MKVSKSLLLFALLVCLLPQICLAIAGPASSIASTAQLPQFSSLIGGNGLLDVILQLARDLFFVVATIFIVIAGYQYLTASGNEEKVKKATSSMIYGVLGMVVVALSDIIVNIFKTLQAPDAPSGVSNFQAAVKTALEAILGGLQFLAGTVAVFFLLLAAYNYITAAGNDERIKKATQSLIYSITGMVVVFLAGTVVKVLETLKQENPTANTPTLTNFQTAAESFLKAILNGMQYLAGAIAILFIIIAAYRYITAGGNEEKTKQGTQSLIYSIVGLFVMVISGVINSIFKYTAASGTNPATTTISATDIRVLINSIVVFASSLVGGLAILMLVYAGFVWITAHGNDEQVAKAKKIITFAVLGLIVIIFAYALVSLVLNVGQAPKTS